MAVTTRLRDAMNAHDLDAFLDCFHEDYKSENGRIAWGRLYVEPVEAAEEGIDAAVQKMAGRPSDSV